MRPLSRRPVSKSGSASSFRSGVQRTKLVNLAPPPMRGGYRL